MTFIKNTFVDGTPLAAADLNTNFSNLLNLLVFNEDVSSLNVSGAITFFTAFPFKPGTINVFLDGKFVRRNTGTLFFTETLNTNGDGISITLNTVSNNKDLLFNYQKSQNN